MVRNFFFIALGLLSPLLPVTAAEYWFRPHHEKGEFVLKGQRLNYRDYPNGKVTISLSGFTGKEEIVIPVDEDGYFEQAIPVVSVQDVVLKLAGGREVKIFTMPSDTIEIRYDINHVMDTFEIRGKNDERDKELELCWQIYRKFRNRLEKLQSESYRLNVNREEFLAKTNRYYHEKIDLIDGYLDSVGPLPWTDKFRNETYFEAAEPLSRISGELEKLDCRYPIIVIEKMVDVGGEIRLVPVDSTQYNKLSEEVFMDVPAYRDYLKEYLFKKMLMGTVDYFTNASNNSVRDKYYFGFSVFSRFPRIRDWFLYQTISDGFARNDFENTSAVYEQFLVLCENELYAEKLLEKYERSASIAPGQPAPEFELQDLEGRTVRLSDFRGSIVYLDFWGYGCGPCYDQFQYFTAPMKEKYKDHDIVYLYICTNPANGRYKSILEKYNPEGVHLLVPEFRHPVTAAYNVTGIPHYVLIDKEGKIASTEAPRPSDLMHDRRNVLDELLGIER